MNKQCRKKEGEEVTTIYTERPAARVKSNTSEYSTHSARDFLFSQLRDDFLPRAIKLCLQHVRKPSYVSGAISLARNFINSRRQGRCIRSYGMKIISACVRLSACFFFLFHCSPSLPRSLAKQIVESGCRNARHVWGKYYHEERCKRFHRTEVKGLFLNAVRVWRCGYADRCAPISVCL